MEINRGDIFWVNPAAYAWKQSGENAIKAGRPAVIVSNDRINGEGLTCEVVYLTTHPKFDDATCVTIRSARDVSTALCGQISTVSTEQIGDKCGECSEREMEAINKAIMISLNLYYDNAPSAVTDRQDTALEKKLSEALAREEKLRAMCHQLLDQLSS